MATYIKKCGYLYTVSMLSMSKQIRRSILDGLNLSDEIKNGQPRCVSNRM